MKRCPAKCKTTTDHKSIKFIELNHNHGINSCTKQLPKKKSSKDSIDSKIETIGVIQHTTKMEI